MVGKSSKNQTYRKSGTRQEGQDLPEEFDSDTDIGNQGTSGFAEIQW
nr:hypothetical protein [Enterococcus cecorum]